MNIKEFAKKEDDGTMRSFQSGATRDTGEGKLDMEGFTHPMVEKQFAKYMNMNRLQSDGQLRDSDNWQKGIPVDAYVKSLRRHHDEVWEWHRGFNSKNGVIAALCGVMFNARGLLHEILKERGWQLQDFDGDEPTPEMRERQTRVSQDSEPLPPAEFARGTVGEFIESVLCGVAPHKPPCYDCDEDCGECEYDDECDDADCDECDFDLGCQLIADPVVSNDDDEDHDPKECGNCRHTALHFTADPCRYCFDHKYWEPAQEDEPMDEDGVKDCWVCENRGVPYDALPCRVCIRNGGCTAIYPVDKFERRS